MLEEEGYTDLNYFMPSVLTDDDLDCLLFKYMNLRDVEMDESFIFSQKFLDTCQASFREKIVESIFKAP